MPENGVTAPTKDMQGIEVYIKGSIPLDLGDKALAEIQRINDSALLIDSELSGALFGIGDKGKSPSVTGSIEDLKKGGLVSAVPNGFLLLHNDLLDLILAKDEAATSAKGAQGAEISVKGAQGAEASIKESAPLGLDEETLAYIQSIGDTTRLVDSELSGALFGEGEKGKAPSITGNIDDVKKGGLVSVIPNGFLLLHNDLAAFGSSGAEKDKNEGSGSKLSFLSDFVKGFAGAAGVAAGAAAALALFNGGESTSESLSGVIKDLDADISADDYKDDPEVAAIKREAVLGYLRMYYTSQTASLAGDTVGNALSSAVTSFVTGVAGDLFDALLGREDDPAATSLEAIATTLDSSISMDELGLSEGGEYRELVVAEKRKATASYLAAYYIGQIANLAATDAASTFSDVAGELVGGTLRKIYEKLKGKEEDATSLESFVSVLDSSMTMEELGIAEGGEHREIVLAEKRVATAAYLAAYYAGQIGNLAATDAASTFSDVAGELVGGTLRKIYEKLKGKEEDATSLGSFVSALDASMSMDELGIAEGGDHRETVLKEKRLATIAYLAAYYAGQIGNLAAMDTTNTFSDVASELVTGTISKIYDKLKGKEEEATSLGSFVSTLDSSMGMDELGLDEGGAYREVVVAKKREATAAYLSEFYNGQIRGLASSSLASTIGDFAIDLVTSTISKIFGKRKSKEEDATSLEAFATSLDTSMTMEDLGLAPGGAYREEVAEEKRKATKAYLTAFYSGQTPTSDMIASDDQVSTFAKNNLIRLFSMDTTEGSDSLKSFVVELDKSLTMEDLGLASGGAYREEVVEEKRKTVAAYIDSYYASQLDAVTQDKSNSITDAADTVRSTLQGIFKGSTEASGLTSLVAQLDGDISLDELGFNKGGANRSRVLGVQSDAVAEYLKAYYSSQVNSLTKDLASNAAGSSVTSTVKSFFSGLFDKKSGSTDPFLESLKTITQNLGTEMDVSKFSYNNNAAVRDAMDSSVGEYLTELLSKEKDALIDSIDDKALRASAREALAKVSLDLSPLASLSLPKYKIATEETAEGETASAATTYDDRNVLRKLDDIVANLEALLGAFKKNTGNTTVINTGGGGTYSIDEEFRIQ